MTSDAISGGAYAVLRWSGEGGRRPELTRLTGVRRFAGYATPAQLVADASLTREEKASGLGTWREAAVRGVPGEATDRLIAEIDRALREFAGR